MAPSDVASEEQFPLEVHVYSQESGDGTHRASRGRQKLGARDVQLAPGINRIAFETSIKSESGPVTVEAEVSAPGDTFPNNNKFHTRDRDQRSATRFCMSKGMRKARGICHRHCRRKVSVVTTARLRCRATAADLDACTMPSC